MFIQTGRGSYNLEFLIKYEVLNSGVIRLLFSNGDIALIEKSDEKTKTLFNQYIATKQLQ